MPLEKSVLAIHSLLDGGTKQWAPNNLCSYGLQSYTHGAHIKFQSLLEVWPDLRPYNVRKVFINISEKLYL